MANDEDDLDLLKWAESLPPRTEITAERLREVLSYDLETGWFRWRVSPKHSGIRIGRIAGQCDCGYWRIEIDGKAYLAHRLAWLYVTGKFPDQQIDHVNGDGTYNAWCNLR